MERKRCSPNGTLHGVGTTRARHSIHGDTDSLVRQERCELHHGALRNRVRRLFAGHFFTKRRDSLGAAATVGRYRNVSSSLGIFHWLSARENA